MFEIDLAGERRGGKLTSRKDAIGDCLGGLLLLGLFCGLYDRPVMGFFAEDQAFCCGTGACLAGRVSTGRHTGLRKHEGGCVAESSTKMPLEQGCAQSRSTEELEGQMKKSAKSAEDFVVEGEKQCGRRNWRAVCMGMGREGLVCLTWN